MVRTIIIFLHSSKKEIQKDINLLNSWFFYLFNQLLGNLINNFGIATYFDFNFFLVKLLKLAM